MRLFGERGKYCIQTYIFIHSILKLGIVWVCCRLISNDLMYTNLESLKLIPVPTSLENNSFWVAYYFRDFMCGRSGTLVYDNFLSSNYSKSGLGRRSGGRHTNLCFTHHTDPCFRFQVSQKVIMATIIGVMKPYMDKVTSKYGHVYSKVGDFIDPIWDDYRNAIPRGNIKVYLYLRI